MSERTLHFTARGFRPQLVDIAPEAADPRSKRTDTIQKEDENLDRNLGELEEGTKARNRAFQRRLDEVWSLTAAWEAKLRTEAREAVETITQLRDDYQVHVDTFAAELQTEIKDMFDKFDNERIPTATQRIDAIEAKDWEFVKVTVPKEINETSGEVRRQMKKAYEGFLIERQKTKIRENKFVVKASQHIQRTAQKFTDEDALLTACFHTLTDDVVEHERRAARMHLYRWDKCDAADQELRHTVNEEAGIRTEEDVDLLDTIVDTQQLLQKTILEHFGSDGESADFPIMEKLNKRLAKSEDRKEKRGKASARGNNNNNNNNNDKSARKHSDTSVDAHKA